MEDGGLHGTSGVVSIGVSAVEGGWISGLVGLSSRDDLVACLIDPCREREGCATELIGISSRRGG
jgi:hypothetical protein